MECPLGAKCTTAGLDVASLPLRPGFWRRNDTTADVRRCPADESSLFSRANASAAADDDAAAAAAAGCAGGVGAGASLCAAGLSGVYCSECSDEWKEANGSVWYSVATRRCEACSVNVAGLATLVVFVVAAAAAAIADRLTGSRVRRHAGRLAAKVAHSWTLRRAVVKLKTLDRLLPDRLRDRSRLPAAAPRVAALLNPLGWLKLRARRSSPSSASASAATPAGCAPPRWRRS